MSVLVSKRRLSKLEVISFSVTLHDMLRDLIRRNFGVRDLDQIVRKRYAYGLDKKEDFSFYRYQMARYKKRIDDTAALMTNNVRAANSIYPRSMSEYEQRRAYQNMAIANCEQLTKDLQTIVDLFDVDLNIYGKYVDAIRREIDLIKKWCQKDNKIKSYLTG